jgi:hypothetical protein
MVLPVLADQPLGGAGGLTAPIADLSDDLVHADGASLAGPSQFVKLDDLFDPSPPIISLSLFCPFHGYATIDARGLAVKSALKKLMGTKPAQRY